jgi:hypothetical protein
MFLQNAEVFNESRCERFSGDSPRHNQGRKDGPNCRQLDSAESEDRYSLKSTHRDPFNSPKQHRGETDVRRGFSFGSSSERMPPFQVPHPVASPRPSSFAGSRLEVIYFLVEEFLRLRGHGPTSQGTGRNLNPRSHAERDLGSIVFRSPNTRRRRRTRRSCCLRSPPPRRGKDIMGCGRFDGRGGKQVYVDVERFVRSRQTGRVLAAESKSRRPWMMEFLDSVALGGGAIKSYRDSRPRQDALGASGSLLILASVVYSVHWDVRCSSQIHGEFQGFNLSA